MIDITGYTTFGVPAQCRCFREYSSVKELQKILREPEYAGVPVLHIGAGSNMLFAEPFEGLVLHSRITGIQRYDKDENTAFVIAGAGENWSSLVDWCVAQGLAGMENMAYIPGEVGAAPVQNVGAYGAEAKDVIHSVELFDTYTNKVVTMNNRECGFAYRDSIFKHEAKGRYYVLRVSFRLTPSTEARNLEYGPLKHLAETLGHTPTIAEVRDEVVRIRKSKLPEPEVVGSAGSFFTNPIMPEGWFREVIARDNPEIPTYPVEGKPRMVKIPAGWLIEHAGLKGYKIGGAQVWPQQCLVLANTDHATAQDVVSLCDHVRSTVKERFNVELHPEVSIIRNSIQVTVLGSGTSKGVPEVACKCRVCASPDPHDRRSRASVLVNAGGMNLLIDPGPDFRQQALDHNINDIDAVLVTHSHYDHVGGIDDLRPFCMGRDLPIYVREDVYGDLHRRLDYAFREHLYPGVPRLNLIKIEDKPFEINGLEIIPINVFHAKLPIYGYRIGNFAYITDAKRVPEDEIDKLEGVDTLIVNALRAYDHFSHFTIAEAIDFISKVKPRQAYLTHISHDFGRQAEVEPTLPEGINVAYDGLTFRCS